MKKTRIRMRKDLRFELAALSQSLHFVRIALPSPVPSRKASAAVERVLLHRQALADGARGCSPEGTIDVFAVKPRSLCGGAGCLGPWAEVAKQARGDEPPEELSQLKERRKSKGI